MPTNPAFADRLRQIRHARGLTQQALAEASGVSCRSVVELERGRHEPKLATAAALARALGMGVEDFLRDNAPG